MDNKNLLKRFDPPGELKDFDDIPNQLEQWSAAMSGWFDEAIASELALFKTSKLEQPCQFINPTQYSPTGTRLTAPRRSRGSTPEFVRAQLLRRTGRPPDAPWLQPAG